MNIDGAFLTIVVKYLIVPVQATGWTTSDYLAIFLYYLGYNNELT